MNDKKVRYKVLPENLQSEYLRTKFLEKIVLRDVEFDTNERTGKAKIDLETDEQQWSEISAYRAASQLAIGYLCTQTGKTKEQIGEVIRRKPMQFNPRKTITEFIGVPIEISFPKYNQRENRIFGRMSCDIGNGSFIGELPFTLEI